MRDSSRIYKIANLLAGLWGNDKNRDMRFFQFVDYLSTKINLANAKPPGTDMFYVEDSVTEEALAALLKAEPGYKG